MIEIKRIYKKNIPELLNNSSFWSHSFLSISKHRLLAHAKNPNSDDNDIVLLLAYVNFQLGVYIQKQKELELVEKFLTRCIMKIMDKLVFHNLHQVLKEFMINLDISHHLKIIME